MSSKPSRPEELLQALAASPRASGSVALRDARARCVAELAALGYVSRERPFEFSAFPGRFGTPDIGISAIAAVAIATHVGARDARWAPLLILVWSALVIAGVGRWLVRRGVLTLPVLRANGVNLEAQLPGGRPAIWLCAHLDSKSQPVPTLIRTLGIMLLAAGALLAFIVAAAAAFGFHPPYAAWVAAAVVTLVGGLPVVSSVVGNRSDGALDNASGVATVLAAAQLLRGEQAVGVLITDAEELGLAGARAWASERGGETVLNCDGVDDTGPINVLYTGRRPERVLTAARAAAASSRGAIVTRRIPLGILMDSVAFADSGMHAVTFSRGTYRSLARVHSSADNLGNLRGAGIGETAALMAATARMLLKDATPTTNDGASR